MYLMFNNYGYSDANAQQIVDGGENWATVVKPEPLCFAFRAGDSFARMANNRIEMVVKYEHLIRHTYNALANPSLDVEATFLEYEAVIPDRTRTVWNANGRLQAIAIQGAAAALANRDEFDSLHLSPRACIYVTGRDHNLEFMRQLQGHPGGEHEARPRAPREEPHQPAPVRAHPEPRHAAGLHRAAEPRHAPPAARDARL